MIPIHRERCNGYAVSTYVLDGNSPVTAYLLQLSVDSHNVRTNNFGKFAGGKPPSVYPRGPWRISYSSAAGAGFPSNNFSDSTMTTLPIQ